MDFIQNIGTSRDSLLTVMWHVCKLQENIVMFSSRELGNAY